MADESTPEATGVETGGITEEQYQLVLDAGHELAKIAVAIDHLALAHGNSRLGMMDASSVYDSKLFRHLDHRRQELRNMLLDLG